MPRKLRGEKKPRNGSEGNWEERDSASEGLFAVNRSLQWGIWGKKEKRK